jgi:hypothetical protein
MLDRGAMWEQGGKGSAVTRANIDSMVMSHLVHHVLHLAGSRVFELCGLEQNIPRKERGGGC